MTKPSKYEALDALILTRIEGGTECTFFRILASVNVQCAPFVTPDSGSGKILDRRLQALRKAGKITFNRSVASWEIAKPADNASA